MPRRTVTEYLDELARREDAPAYSHKRGYRRFVWSYAEIAVTASQTARLLDSHGIGAGDRVIVWGENCAEWVCVFFACLLRGAIAVPIDRTSIPDFAQRVAGQVEAKAAFCAEELKAALAQHCPTFNLLQVREQVAPFASSPYPSTPALPDDTVEIVFTSGTTSEPKGVVISHRNILASLVPIETEIAKYIRYERPFHPIRFLNLLPLSHVFGQFLGIFIPQLLGGVVYFQDSLDPAAITEVIRRERISVCVAVPRILQSLKDHTASTLRADPMQDPEMHFLRRWWKYRSIHRNFGWKFWAFISGGATLDGDTEEFWRRLGYVVIQGYGMTESTSLISVNHPFKLGRHSIGKVLPGRDLKLDPDTGEILVRGENIARAYWTRDGMQPVAGDEGWLHTGDVGEMDADGNLYFRGRKKNVIVTPEGLNVYPEDIEAAIRAQSGIRDCVVIGLKREANSVPAAAIIPQVRGADASDAVQHANESLADFQRIRNWMVWPDDDFPRTSTQKPRIAEIEARMNAQFGQTATLAHDPQSLRGIIGSITRTSAADTNAHDDNELNLGSLDRVELASAIEDRYLVHLEDSRIANVRTVRELEQLLHNSNAGQAIEERQPYPYPQWQMSWPVRAVRSFAQSVFVTPAVFLLARPRVRGGERISAQTGPMLIVSNHVTATDIGFLLYALPRRLRRNLTVAMSGELLRDMRHPPRTLNVVQRWIEQLSYVLVVALFNVQPLPQQADFRRSFDNLGRAADRGYSVAVFPEGKRTTTGEMNPFRSGIGLLATRLQVPVLPMRIDGLFRYKTERRHYARPGDITVQIGELRMIRSGDAEEIARALESAVREL